LDTASEASIGKSTLISWLDALVQDVRQAARGLRRSPGYALTAIGMLALGIGVNTAVFTIAYSVLFKGFPLVERNESSCT
jgi:hypothetical protein